MAKKPRATTPPKTNMPIGGMTGTMAPKTTPPKRTKKSSKC